jgi:hypothetical protein
VIDRRLWYGLLVRGQVNVPTVYSTGQATFTQNSNLVTGVGTGWTQAMAGMQIRSGFSTGWYNIASVNPSNQTLILDLPWGNPTLTQVGYSIVQTWITMGSNIKLVLEMVNQRQGIRLWTNVPQAVLNAKDVWRTTQGWTRVLASKEPMANGSPQFELWPAPTYQQAFPFLAYTQPPDLALDGDTPATFVRSDIVVLPAIKDALLFKGKSSKYYDPTVAGIKEKEFQTELEKMELNDDNSYRKDVQWNYNSFPAGSYDALFQQSHDFSSLEEM